jgi:hypothetical protein
MFMYFPNLDPNQFSGNLMQGNDFGSTGITVVPATGFTNGGGNTCGGRGTINCNGIRTIVTTITIAPIQSISPFIRRQRPALR